MGVEHLKDNPNRLNSHTKAEHVKEGEDQTKLRLPTGAAVVSRDTDIPVVGVQKDVQLSLDGETTAREEGTLDMTQVVKRENAAQPIESECHEDASLTAGIGAQAMTVAEHGVGVQPVSRTVTHLDSGSPVNVQGEEKTASAHVEPEPPPAPKTVTRETHAVQPQTVPTPDPTPPPPAPAAAPAPAQPAPAPFTGEPRLDHPGPVIEKHRVVLASNKMGRHRITVNKLSISDTMVILGYVDNDDAVIVEPPISDSQEDTLAVTIDGTKYDCVYYGFTTNMQIDGHDMLLVVLVRADG